MDKFSRFLGRSKTFNSYDNKKRRNNNKADDTVAPTTAPFDNAKLPPYQQHLAKVSNPSDPQGTLQRLEKENLKLPKIKQLTGTFLKKHRNSFSSEDIAIRQPSAGPKPPRQQRTKTMFDFWPKSKKAAGSSAPPPHEGLDNRRAQLDADAGPGGPRRRASAKTVPLRRKPAELSSVQIDIDGPAAQGKRTLQLRDTRTYSRSMNDIIRVGRDKLHMAGSVRVLKERFEEVPIMGRVSLTNKGADGLVSTPSSKRRSSLPTDFKDLPPTPRVKRDRAMANNQQPASPGPIASPSTNVSKNSQHDLTPKSPTAKISADSNSNEDNLPNPQKTSTNRKSIKNILQKFLNRRPSQQELVTKGIIQDQRIFGNSLRNLCKHINGIGQPRIPDFVSEAMKMIEDDRNVVSHGIYRASGNIATIQKIRIRVNEGKNLDILKEYRKDVDVLTGSLKLFFRELTEPLISTEMYTELCNLKDKELTDHDRLYTELDRIVKRQPDYHRDVLLALVDHILYVNSFGEKNSMSIDSMSIVWGPSLIFTDNEDSGMLLQRMTNNNSIVKFLLNVYNRSYLPNKRLYKTESTLSLASTSDKSISSRPSFKQQQSIDESLSIEDMELLIKSIQDSELAKRINVYVNFKAKKSKKILDRIKAKKSIEKYAATKDGLCGIVEILKGFVSQSAVVPEEFIEDYDGSTLHSKDIETFLDRLPATNHRILELVLNHLNDMHQMNHEKYSFNLLLLPWTRVLFVDSPANPNAEKYLEQLLEYHQKTRNDRLKQNTLQKIMMSDLSESFQLRGTRLSGSESSLDAAVLNKRISTDSGDVEIRKSQLHQHVELQERKRSNRNS